MCSLTWYVFALSCLRNYFSLSYGYSFVWLYVMLWMQEKLVSTNFYLNKSAKDAYRSYLLAYNSHSMKEIFNVHRLDMQVRYENWYEIHYHLFHKLEYMKQMAQLLQSVISSSKFCSYSADQTAFEDSTLPAKGIWDTWTSPNITHGKVIFV